MSGMVTPAQILSPIGTWLVPPSRRPPQWMPTESMIEKNDLPEVIAREAGSPYFVLWSEGVTLCPLRGM